MLCSVSISSINYIIRISTQEVGSLAGTAILNDARAVDVRDESQIRTNVELAIYGMIDLGLTINVLRVTYVGIDHLRFS